MARSRWSAARSRLARTAFAVLGAAALFAATPAFAHDDDDGWRGRGRHGSHGHGRPDKHHWRSHGRPCPPRFSYAPPVYYAPPPPVYYAPPVVYGPPAYPRRYREPRGGIHIGVDWFAPF